MPHYERTVTMTGDRAYAYELAKEMEAFPKYMEAVRDVKVLERGPDWTITRWEAVAMGHAFKWSERDEFDDAALRITYRLVDGDLKTFEGEWRFAALGSEQFSVTLTVDAELGVPLFAAMINPLLGKILQLNVDSMMDGFKKIVESRATKG